MQSNTSSKTPDQPPEARIEALRLRHANFDRQIQALTRCPSAGDEVAILKKDKLRIKDEIARLSH